MFFFNVYFSDKLSKFYQYLKIKKIFDELSLYYLIKNYQFNKYSAWSKELYSFFKTLKIVHNKGSESC